MDINWISLTSKSRMFMRRPPSPGQDVSSGKSPNIFCGISWSAGKARVTRHEMPRRRRVC